MKFLDRSKYIFLLDKDFDRNSKGRWALGTSGLDWSSGKDAKTFFKSGLLAQIGTDYAHQISYSHAR